MVDDVFIFKTSGIPLFGKCFGGEYCKLHPDHSLQTGFLAAIYSYSQESFGDEIQCVIFNEIKLDFKIDKEKELILVFANPVNLGTEIIKEQLNRAMERFLEKFGDKIGDIIIEGQYQDFEEDLMELNVVSNPSMGDIAGIAPKKSLWSRFISKILGK